MKEVVSAEYTQLARIGVGQGANAEVWKINEPQLGGIMAVKEIPMSRLDPAEYFAEAHRVFAASHPNVAPIQYASRTNDKICLIMPLCSGGSLASRIEHGPLPEREVIRVGIGVLSGLSHIHGQQVTHFDVKPSNVLFSDADEPMVSDFGQARKLGPLGTVRVPRLYPDAYPPEAYKGAVGSAQTDIYHVGITLYRAVNGDPHYTPQVPADDAEHQRRTLKGKFPDRSHFMPHVGSRLKTIIRKAMKVEPTQRYQTAEEMRVALGRIQIDLDWQIVVTPALTTWRAKRPQQPDLVVRLEQCGGSFSVSVQTEQSGKPPRTKNAAKFTHCSTSEREAYKHLSESVFPELAA